jgi:glycosyltransferase involved in cell wall biosynthesis
VQTFSINAAVPEWLSDPEDRQEAARTYNVLDRPLSEFIAAHVTELTRGPLRYLRTFGCALRHRAPGVKALALALIHFVESILLASELRRRNVTHLHNHFANSAATVGFLASIQTGLTWSFTIHGISEFDYPAGLLLPDKIAAASFVACASYFGRAQAARMVDPIQWSKLNIVRCGLEFDRLPQGVEKQAGLIRLILVGRLSAEKGIAGLLDALATLKSRNKLQLVIVGEGPMQEELHTRVQRLGLEGRVEFRGRLPEMETLDEIARSDIMVLPSFMEGLPVVLMEAAALGKPVLASRVAGIPELVADEVTGLLFAPSNWNELAHQLERLIEDDDLRRRLGEAGLERVSQEFDIRISVRRLLDLLSQAVPFEPNRKAPLSESSPGTLEPSKEHKVGFEAVHRD